MNTAARLLASITCFFLGSFAVGYSGMTLLRRDHLGFDSVTGKSFQYEFGEAGFVIVVFALMMSTFHLTALLLAESLWAGMSMRRVLASAFAAGGGAAIVGLGLSNLLPTIAEHGVLSALLLLGVPAVIATFVSLRVCRAFA